MILDSNNPIINKLQNIEFPEKHDLNMKLTSESSSGNIASCSVFPVTLKTLSSELKRNFNMVREIIFK